MKLRTGFRSALAIAVALLLTALAVVGSASAAVPTVTGTVGPSFKISLTRGGKKVTRLKATTYRFKVADKSSAHDFHLSGPGVDKVITGVGFKGTKTVTLRLRRGTYRYFCDPHSSQMHGSFSVG